MIDGRQVTYDIERCVSHVPDACRDCSHYTGTVGFECMEKLMSNALELLKEHEPVLLKNQHKPYGDSLNANAPWISRCPACNKKVEGKQTRFCKYCGQAVKWNES